MLRTDIGEGINALQCTTDLLSCCSDATGEIRAGEFYLPDGSRVLISTSPVEGYYRDRGSQLIRLHRQTIATVTGQFRCNIPRVSGSSNVNLYINIGEYETISACHYAFMLLP